MNARKSRRLDPFVCIVDLKGCFVSHHMVFSQWKMEKLQKMLYVHCSKRNQISLLFSFVYLNRSKNKHTDLKTNIFIHETLTSFEEKVVFQLYEMQCTPYHFQEQCDRIFFIGDTCQKNLSTDRFRKGKHLKKDA